MNEQELREKIGKTLYDHWEYFRRGYKGDGWNKEGQGIRMIYQDVTDRILALIQPKPLFKVGDFTLHSGGKSDFKIDCDALSETDWKSLAHLISKRCKFKAVRGVPAGGLKLREYLSLYCIDDESLPTLIVDDVLTTGASMEEERKQVKGEVIGYVVFARGVCPEWVTPIFNMWASFRQPEPLFKEGD